MEMSEEKPRVLVLGGVGFIGRNLVKYLVENDLCSYIRVCDKQMPETSFFHEECHLKAFRASVVDHRQCDLTRDDHVRDRAFSTADGPIHLVFNLAGETKYGQAEHVYQQKVVDITRKCVRRFVEVSDAHLYKSQSKKPATEGSEIKPWTALATAKVEAEKALGEVAGLEHVIVYGPADVGGVMPRVVCGAVYRYLGETMKFLWDKSMHINTVHVRDVVRALWHVAHRATPGSVYNLADKGFTNQGKVNSVLSSIFGIKTGFHGTVVSNLARIKLTEVAEAANEKHLSPWTRITLFQGIEFTPLTPYIDKELLKHNHLFVNGSKIEETGFTYEHPELTEELVREMIDLYVSQNAFPSLDKITPGGAASEETKS